MSLGKRYKNKKVALVLLRVTVRHFDTEREK